MSTALASGRWTIEPLVSLAELGIGLACLPNFAVRRPACALSESMTREFGPLGIHVAHIVIDGGIAGGKLLNPYPQLAEERSEDGLLSIEGIAENVLSDSSPAALSLDPRD